MFEFSVSKKNKNNYQSAQNSEPFLVDLRSIIKEKEDKMEEKVILMAQKKNKDEKLKKKKFVKRSFI